MLGGLSPAQAGAIREDFNLENAKRLASTPHLRFQTDRLGGTTIEEKI